MSRRAPFIHKVLNRLERVDRESVQTYLTDLARENSLFTEMLDHLNEGVLIVSGKGKTLWANRQASLWLGLDEKKFDRPVHEGIRDRELAQFITGHLKGLKERFVGDIGVLTPREMRLRVFLVPLEHRSSEEETLVLLANISEELSRNEEKMSRIEALASLAAGIAHEIGNPLNSITIHLELLKKEAKSLPDPKRKSVEKTLEILTSETGRLDRIVRSFLKATRKPPLRFRAEDLNQIVDEAVNFMTPELKDQKIKISVSLDKNLPSFMLDRERIYQALINLIKNAMEAMPEGGRLFVSVSHEDKIASLSVKDEGKGIDETDMPHIFEAYYTTKREGSGLGLMTVYSVVREHGGRIEVASKMGQGSQFILHLPIRQPKLQLGYKR
jgi:two-component system, sporulation sensor kinase E